MLTPNPYIHFPGTTREAMEFYVDVFGGHLRMDTYGDMASENMPATNAHLIAHAHLETPYGLTLMGTDAAFPIKRCARPNVHISLNGAAHDHQLLQQYWHRLAEHGTVTHPLDAVSQKRTSGAVTDQFGINWRFAIDEHPN